MKYPAGYLRALPFALRCLYKVWVGGILRQIYSLLFWICMSVLCCSATVFLIIVKSRRKCGNLLEGYHLNMKRHFTGLMQGMEIQKREAMSHTNLGLCDCIFCINSWEISTSIFVWSVGRESSCWVWIWVFGHEGLM